MLPYSFLTTTGVVGVGDGIFATGGDFGIVGVDGATGTAAGVGLCTAFGDVGSEDCVKICLNKKM